MKTNSEILSTRLVSYTTLNIGKLIAAKNRRNTFFIIAVHNFHNLQDKEHIVSSCSKLKSVPLLLLTLLDFDAK